MKHTAAVGLVVLLLSSGASAAAICIEPPDSTVTVGSQVSLNVNISDVSDLFASSSMSILLLASCKP